MPTIPSEQELYDEMRASVTGDPSTNLTDFSPGAVLDVMAGTVATAARSIMRWILRTIRTAFVSTSDDADLDFVIADRVGGALPRLTGETDEEYRARYYDYIRALSRGIEAAWIFFIERVVEGVDTSDYTLEEDLESGIVTITISPLAGYTETQIFDNAQALLSEWSVLGGPAVNIVTEP